VPAASAGERGEDVATVTLELRRGDDYTLLDTQAAASAYDPDKLSMEKTEGVFTPEDRIGALEMQNLSVVDNRSFLLHWLSSVRRLPGSGTAGLANLLGEGEGEGEGEKS